MNIVGLPIGNGFLVHLPSGPLAWIANLVKSVSCIDLPEVVQFAARSFVIPVASVTRSQG